MKDIAFCILLAIAPFLPFYLFDDDNDLDEYKHPLPKHKPSSTAGSSKRKNTKKRK